MTREQKPESADFRTREAQLASHFGPHFLADFTEEGLRKELIEAEARGAAEQRRKDAEGMEQPTCYVNAARLRWHLSHGGSYMTTISAEPVKASVPHHNLQDGLYLRPANVAALGASFAWLVEDMRKKDQSAPPLARFDMLFGNDEVSISEARERLEALGIESLYITDDWEDATEGNELSRADVETLPPLHEDEQKAGWKLASAWDTEDGTVIRHYVRPLRTSDQGTANVAALEARVKELEAQLGAMKSGTIRQVIHSPLRHFKPEDRS
ncbi:hypothetical protein [Asaia bogorensis]|uniref:hypothetical protein n=1 Tax=Asaia bogorensis TaxID=91915 RepID=UPI000EFCB3FD|nr:hypothetical protein [Asaia bogorensis]